MGRTKDFKTEEVLEKAMELFWKKGFHATSYHDLVDHLGVHRGSLYSTFGDKDALFLKTMDLYLQQRSVDADKIDSLLAHMSVKDFLKKFFENELKEQIERDHIGCMVANATAELATQNSKVCEVLDNNRSKSLRLFKNIFSIARERGEIDLWQEPGKLANHLFIFYNGLKVVAKLNKPEDLSAAVRVELDLIFQTAV